MGMQQLTEKTLTRGTNLYYVYMKTAVFTFVIVPVERGEHNPSRQLHEISAARIVLHTESG